MPGERDDYSGVAKRFDLMAEVARKLPMLRYVGDPLLATPTTEITDIKAGREIGEELGVVLSQYRAVAGFGRGLAAPQIGISKSVFVTLLSDGLLRVYINPKIKEYYGGFNYYQALRTLTT